MPCIVACVRARSMTMHACLSMYPLPSNSPSCRSSARLWFTQRTACTGAYPPFVHAYRVRVGDFSVYINSSRCRYLYITRPCIRYPRQDFTSVLHFHCAFCIFRFVRSSWVLMNDLGWYIEIS